jgi:membrane-associated phospholipid phosphatase
MAAGTAALRVMNNRHWLSDVIAGAGIGMLTTKGSYWLYSKWENRKHAKQMIYY